MFKKIILTLLVSSSVAGCATTEYIGNPIGGAREASLVSGELNSADLLKMATKAMDLLVNNSSKVQGWASKPARLYIKPTDNATGQASTPKDNSSYYESSALDLGVVTTEIRNGFLNRGLAAIVDPSSNRAQYYVTSRVSRDSKQYDPHRGIEVSQWRLIIEVKSVSSFDTVASESVRFPE